MSRVLDDTDMRHLRRCVEIATEALEAGDEPFGSILVSAEGKVLAEDRNRVAGGDRTRHPEFELARWAAANLTPEERRRATVYTSGEHCPMCAAAHGWVGLGRIVYAASSAQLVAWLTSSASRRRRCGRCRSGRWCRTPRWTGRRRSSPRRCAPCTCGFTRAAMSSMRQGRPPLGLF